MTNDVLGRLAATIKARGQQARGLPYAATPRRRAREAGKKLGEEAVEMAIAALAQDDKALIAEAADLLYHMLVCWNPGTLPSMRSWASSSGA